MSSEIVELPLERVRPNPDQPRRTFDPIKLQELADSIRTHGLQQPIKVTPRGEWFLIVMGERRWRAHQLAGLSTIRAIVEPHTDEEIDSLALIENEQRVDVNVMEMVEAWDRYRRRNGWTVDTLAEKVSRKKREVADLLKLLLLADELKPLVARGQLSAAQGIRLAPLPKTRQLYAVQVMQEHRLSANEFDLLCKQLGRAGNDAMGALFDLDAFLRVVQKEREQGKKERVRQKLLAEISADELLCEMARRGLMGRGSDGEGEEANGGKREYGIPLRGRVMFEPSLRNFAKHARNSRSNS